MKESKQRWKMTPKMIAKLYKMRDEGKSTLKIGRFFRINHTSVLYWIKKKKYVYPKIKPTNFQRKGTELDQYRLPEIIDSQSGRQLLPMEKINPGKNYIDYIKIKAKKENKSIRNYLYGAIRKDMYDL